MRILVTNDDGILADGIGILAQEEYLSDQGYSSLMIRLQEPGQLLKLRLTLTNPMSF
jgi:hypothetical protein